ncbi:MAG: glycine--tRNA ligase subunit beta [Thiomicrospira sp.]|uniref:glycine--tRNA ligase subunit beta n=1 Tax=Thiomicrospira sp. TaxID=935 RepID=UPI001A051DE6|nr:glycine--tRNA ligase subunit beta [Thiomicrospira sp.]MBE0493678.1 glycine--tRNA ligase subunit beta [Thiomicrospira sp.]
MSSVREDFLVEIGTEELPPKALKKLSQAFAQGLTDGLNQADLKFETVKVYAAPRRLAVWVQALDLAQADKVVERKGPAKKAAFDADGNPTKALQGFARSCDVGVADLMEIETDKGTWMVYEQAVKGQATRDLLPGLVEASLAKLPIPKRMRWGTSDVEFVRPVHWVLMILGDQVVPANILGKVASNVTRGHRFHAPEEIVVDTPADYAIVLKKQGYVLADFAERQTVIRQQVLGIASQAGGEAVIDEDLLEEVTALNEWPTAVVGSFDEDFLSVPPECLISAMKGHQKFFHLLDKQGKLQAKFITVCNIESINPQSVISGNERVIRPRLSDAKFFWNQDRKQPLDDLLPSLKTVVFQQKLGTLYDKIERLESLAVKIARPLGVPSELAERAARLSKCDLMTLMVGEFPELQGVMGRYYALAQNEHADVADSLDQQYQPRFGGDDLPETALAQTLAIADKLDTITGIYGIGELPTGDKDPFALRRAALGLIRIMIEKELDLDLQYLIEASVKLHPKVESSPKLVNAIYDFIISRLKAYYADQGISAEAFEAVRVCRPAHPIDFSKRIEAVRAFAALPAAESLSAANKRIQNILRKMDGEWPLDVDSNLFEQPAETQLWQAIEALREQVSSQIAARDYTQALTTLAQIREPVDQFFDQVMVMADDEALKRNRLAMLNQIHQLFLAVADISRL